MWETILVQGVGFAGLLFFISSYQIKSNRALYVCQSLGSLMFALQYVLLGQITGAYTLVVVVLRNMLYAVKNKYPWAAWNGWPWIISAICTVILFITWKGWISLLPFIAVQASTFLYWTGNAQKIRIANLAFASPAWLIYGIIAGSWGGIINEVITLTSILVSIWRYGWKDMGEWKK